VCSNKSNLPTRAGDLKQYLTQLPTDARIAVEATGNWMWLYELIEERHPDLVLAHPLKTNAIASARIKPDKIDATTLAQLLRADLVPAAYIPPRDVRDTREVLRYRASLVRLRAQVKRIRSRPSSVAKGLSGQRPGVMAGSPAGSARSESVSARPGSHFILGHGPHR